MRRFLTTPDGQIKPTAFSEIAVADLPISDIVKQTITNGQTTTAPSEDAVFDALALKANINSPTFTGTPTAPTPTVGTNTTQLATTAFTMKEVYGEPLGQLFAETFANTNNFTSTGGASLSIVGGKLRVDGGSATQTDLSRYSIYTPYVTALDKWVFEATYTIDTYNATSFGPGFGIQSAADNSGGRFSFQWFLDCSSAGTGGKIYLYYNNATIVPSTTTTTNPTPTVLPLALNDTIHMVAERKGSQFTVTFTNVTSERSITQTYEFKLGIQATPIIMPNKGNFAVYSKGSSTNDVSVFTVKSDAYKNPDYLVFGDSITAGYFNGDIDNRWVNLLSMFSGRKIVNIAQASHVTSDGVDLLPEITLIAPRAVILAIGTNDVESTNLATFQAQMALLTAGLDAISVPYYICTILPRNDANDPRTFNTWLFATYPTNIIIDLFYAFSDGSAFGGINALYSDLVHLNYAGNLKFANIVSNFLNINKVVTRYRPSTFDNIVEPIQAYNTVNYMTVTGGATTVAPSFSITGSDTNIGLNITAKGINTSSSAFRWNGGGFGINVPIGVTVGARLETVNEVAAEGIRFSQYTTDAIGNIIMIRKARGTRGSPTTVANSDQVFSFNSRAYVSTGTFGNIQAGFGTVINGTVTSTLAPTDIVFATSATGGDMAGINSADTRLRITAAGLSGFNLGTTSPHSTVHVNGSVATAYVAKTALYTLTTADYTVEVTSGTHTQTLPTAVGITGRTYVITNSGSGTVTVGTTSSQTFVNVSGTPTTRTLNQFQTIIVQSNGANWLQISLQ